MKWIYVVALASFIGSCRAPMEIIKTDTVVTIRERVLTDTVELLKDTTIYRDSVWVKLEYLPTPLGPQLKVTAKCPEQKIKLQTVTKNRIKTEMDRTGWLVALALGVVLLLTIRR